MPKPLDTAGQGCIMQRATAAIAIRQKRAGVILESPFVTVSDRTPLAPTLLGVMGRIGSESIRRSRRDGFSTLRSLYAPRPPRDTETQPFPQQRCREECSSPNRQGPLRT